MRFLDLEVNQKFRVEAYPECLCIKTVNIKGTCCTPPQNSKLICNVNGVPIEKAVVFDDNQEVFTDTIPEISTAKPRNYVVEEPPPARHMHTVKLSVAKDGGLQDEYGNLVTIFNGKVIPRTEVGGGTFG